METSRRRFLGGLAVASALAGSTAAQSVAAFAERPELLELGANFDTAQARLNAEVDRLPAFQAAYDAIVPEMPADLVVYSGDPAWRRGFADWMLKPSDPNYERLQDAQGKRMEVVQSHRIEIAYGASFDHRNPTAADFSDADEEDLRLYDLAKAYEAEVGEALIVSGLAAALDDYRAAQNNLGRVVRALCSIRAKTPTGIALKIRATAAYAAFGKEERFSASQMLSQAIWEDMAEDA